MRELSLFSGAGGGLLGSLLLGWEPVGYVEFNDYCQRVIAQRIADGILPNAPIFGDVRTFLSEGYAAAYQGMVDVITGGFPCQPFSVAGKQLGAADPRNMWPATVECVRIVRPRYCFFENVSGLLNSGYFGRIVADLAACGYSIRWRVLSAAELGAPHRRDRLWIVAYPNDIGHQRPATRQSDTDEQRHDTPSQQGGVTVIHEAVPSGEVLGDTASAGLSDWTVRKVGQPKPQPQPQRPSSEVAYADFERLSKSGPIRSDAEHTGPEPCGDRGQWWDVEPDVGRVANGVAARVDRLKAIGNGQVPIVAATAWHLLTEGLHA